MATRKPPADRPGTPLSNRNFLSPVGFKFSLKRAPGVAFFCNQANIPSLDLGIAEQPTWLILMCLEIRYNLVILL